MMRRSAVVAAGSRGPSASSCLAASPRSAPCCWPTATSSVRGQVEGSVCERACVGSRGGRARTHARLPGRAGHPLCRRAPVCLPACNPRRQDQPHLQRSGGRLLWPLRRHRHRHVSLTVMELQLLAAAAASRRGRATASCTRSDTLRRSPPCHRGSVQHANLVLVTLAYAITAPQSLQARGWAVGQPAKLGASLRWHPHIPAHSLLTIPPLADDCKLSVPPERHRLVLQLLQLVGHHFRVSTAAWTAGGWYVQACQVTACRPCHAPRRLPAAQGQPAAHVPAAFCRQPVASLHLWRDHELRM